MSPELAADYVASFGGNITARVVQQGEVFLRYTGQQGSKGSFITKTLYASPKETVQALYLQSYGNAALYVQRVTATKASIVLEGSVANGAQGARQTLMTDWGAFTKKRGW